jgi:hypothetical protein
MSVFDILALAPYDLLMLYAFLRVGSAWAWGRRREVNDAALMAFGLALPIGAWAFTQFFSWAGLAIAASYAGLWRWASEREGISEDGLRRDFLEERAAAEARLRVALDDGVAWLTIAQLREREGRWAEALHAYEAAHRLSDRMLPEPALAAARERLGRAIAEKRPAPRVGGARRIEMRRVDWVLAAAGGLVFLWSPPRGLGALAALGFARWLTSGEESRPSNAPF